jgi:hypothetical protein
MELVSCCRVVFSGAAEKRACSVESSVNESSGLVVLSRRSLMKIRKRVDSRTESWGAAVFILEDADKTLSTQTT